MCMRILFVVISTFFFSQTNTPSLDTQNQPIRNYWEHIQNLLKQSEEIREAETLNKGRYSRTSNKKYPFDLFRSLTPRELLRACREGIESAKKEGKLKNWSEDLISRKCEENISYILEFYGVIIEKSSDIDHLIYCIGAEQEEPELRIFLLSQSIPQKNTNSLFGLHFQTLINTRKDEYQKILNAIVKRTNEKPEIQIAGIEALYLFFAEQYQKCVEKDPIYQAHAIENHKKISPLWLEDSKIPKPLDSTQIEASKLGRQLNEFITQLELKIKNKHQMNEMVIKKSQEIVEKVYNNLPFQGKERLKVLFINNNGNREIS